MTERERAVLEFLLATDDPRIVTLRRQAMVATVTAQWSCCPTIELEVDQERARPVLDVPTPAVETRSHRPGQPDRDSEVLLFVRGGWLETLELVHYAGPAPGEFPPVDALDAPVTPSGPGS